MKIIKIILNIALFLLFVPLGFVAILMTILDFDITNLIIAVIGVGVSIPVTKTLIREYKGFRKKHDKKAEPISSPTPTSTSPPASSPTKKSTALMPKSVEEIPLAYHYEAVDVAIIRGMEPDFSQLKINMPVTFEPEPTNQYDPNAVIVKTGNLKIGYLYKGTRQEMTLDYIRRGDPIRSHIVEVDKANNSVKVAIGYYKEKLHKPRENELEQLIRMEAPYKTFKLTGNRNEEMQDTLSLCSEGVEVDYEYDYEKEKYLAICVDEIGYFSKSAEKYLEEEIHPAFIEKIEEDENGKYSVKVTVFYES